MTKPFDKIIEKFPGFFYKDDKDIETFINDNFNVIENNIYHGEDCPIRLAKNGQWPSTLTPFCNCKVSSVKYTSGQAEEERNIIRRQVIAEIKEWARKNMTFNPDYDDLIDFLNKLTNQ